MRTHFILFIFLLLALPVSAAIIHQGNIIPPVIVKAKHHYNFTSGASHTIISHQQIRTTGVASVAQALNELGGVQLQDTTGNGSQVVLSLRGFGSNATSNTLLLINGIPLSNPDTAPPNLNIIPLPEIEFIEVMAGSESVLYGDQAVGGVINIVTHQKTKDNIVTMCSAGSYNLKTCYVALNRHYHRLNYNLSFFKNRTNNYRDHNQYDQNLLSGSLDYPYARGNWFFDYKLTQEYMQYPGSLTTAQVRQNRRQANNDTDFFRDWNGLFQTIWQQQLSTDWQLTVDLSRQDMQGDGVLFSPFTQARHLSFIKPQLKGKLWHTQLITGVDFQNDDYHLGSAFGLTNNRQQKYGLFGMASVPLNTKLTLSFGVRGAQQTSHLVSTTHNHTLNRASANTLGMTYQLTPQLNFYLRRAGSFRFPKADENASAPIGVRYLRTQRGIAYETGVEMAHDRDAAKISLYQLNLRDEIAYDPTQTPQQPFGADRNLVPTVRRGFILSGLHYMTDKLSLSAQYNYVDARFQNGINANKRISLVSETIFHSGINYHMTEHWNIYSEAVYTGNQYPANDDANVAGKIGGYLVYNFNLRYQYQQLSASFRMNNIFNKYYYFYTVYQPSLLLETFYPAPGRNFVLTLNYAFL